jgi:hypothetical protein
VADSEFNKEHAYWFFLREGDCSLWIVPPNTTVSSDFYCDILRRLRENVFSKSKYQSKPHL